MMDKNTKATIAEVAQRAGVSPATVSRVINHRKLVNCETIEAVEGAMEALGYSPSPRKKQTTAAKSVIVMNSPHRDPFYLEVAQGAQTAADANGYCLLNTWNSINASNLGDFIALLKSINATGVILTNQLPQSILKVIDKEIPLVQCCEFTSDADIPFVSIDDYSAAMNATNYLIDAGRKKIAFIGSTPEYKYSIERHQGYIDAMHQAGLPIQNFWDISLPENSSSLAYSAVAQLLNYDDKTPDAIFATSDILAMAVIRSARQRKLRVPEDIMVIGFDDIEFASMTTPSLTTVRQPLHQLGYTACNILFQRMNNPEVKPTSIFLDTTLIIRESTTPNLDIQSKMRGNSFTNNQ